jgi:hypothetical protein
VVGTIGLAALIAGGEDTLLTWLVWFGSLEAASGLIDGCALHRLAPFVVTLPGCGFAMNLFIAHSLAGKAGKNIQQTT